VKQKYVKKHVKRETGWNCERRWKLKQDVKAGHRVDKNNQKFTTSF
jgi:hypothetical protein